MAIRSSAPLCALVGCTPCASPGGSNRYRIWSRRVFMACGEDGTRRAMGVDLRGLVRYPAGIGCTWESSGLLAGFPCVGKRNHRFHVAWLAIWYRSTAARMEHARDRGVHARRPVFCTLDGAPAGAPRVAIEQGASKNCLCRVVSGCYRRSSKCRIFNRGAVHGLERLCRTRTGNLPRG